MHKTFTCMLFCFLFSMIFNHLYCQVGPVIKWQKCIGGSKDDKANDILINSDGSFIIAGYSKSNDGNISGHHGTVNTADALIAKLDAFGNIVWQHSIGGSNDDYFNTVIATNDNAYLCIGYTNSTDGDITNNHGNNDAWVVKISSSGNILWSRCYGGSKYDVAADGVLTPDGQYAIMATSFSYDGDVLSGIYGRTESDAWIFKIDANGDIAWEKCIVDSSGIGYSIIQSEDNNLYALTTTSEQYIEDGNPEPETVTRTPSQFYHIDHITGNTNYIGSMGGDSSFSMCRKADSIYFSYLDLRWNSLVHCWDHYQFISTKADGSGNFSNKFITYTNLCNETGGDYHMFAHTHGIAADDNAVVTVGKYFYGYYGLPFSPQDSGQALIATNYYHLNAYQVFARLKKYGGTGDDGFTSIKVFPTGNDYIASGYTTSNDGDISANHGGYDCWIVRLEGMNKVVGDVYLDENNNNIKDAGEPPFNFGIVKTTKQGFEVGGLAYNGSYLNVTDTGSFTTSIVINMPYYTATPISKTTVFTTYKNTDTANFAIHAIPGIKDYIVSATSLLTPRPGFSLQYKIVYTNNGTTLLTNKDVVFIKDSRTNFLGAVPGYTSISGDTIRWNISSLSPTVSGTILLNLQLGNIPQVNIGDVLVSNINIDSTGDFTPLDNYVYLQENISSSYDPNDKKENNAGEIYPLYIAEGKFLNYTVRFQNSGNDTAFNIIVRDTLDNKLNGDSIEITSASHAYSANIKNKKYLTVTFSNIKLVDSIHNEPLSHGYFSYRIKPLSTVAVGDTIRNSASIYFDFNPPIKTNTEITYIRPTPTTNLWTGAVSTAWEDPLNWGNDLIPDENTNVIINNGLTRYPIITSNAVCRSMQAKTGVNVLVKNGFTLNVTH